MSTSLYSEIRDCFIYVDGLRLGDVSEFESKILKGNPPVTLGHVVIPQMTEEDMIRVMFPTREKRNLTILQINPKGQACHIQLPDCHFFIEDNKLSFRCLGEHQLSVISNEDNA